MSNSTDITAVILAGGKGRRMGGEDKGLVEFAGSPLILHVLSAIEPQADYLVINANRNQEQYAAFDYPVITDTLSGFQGPLAGFLAAMKTITTPDMVSVPCDGPMLPPDLVERLVTARREAAADIAVAHDGNRLQPVYALIPTRLQGSLEAFLQTGERKIDRWYGMHNMVQADFSDIPDTFININTPGERDRLQKERRAA